MDAGQTERGQFPWLGKPCAMQTERWEMGLESQPVDGLSCAWPFAALDRPAPAGHSRGVSGPCSTYTSAALRELMWRSYFW